MRLSLILSVLSALLLSPLQATWKSETLSLNPGWNAIYPLVDTSHATITELFADRPSIEEIWRWQPERIDGRTLDVNAIPQSGGEWGVWRRGNPDLSSISYLLPNYGYLVKVADGSPAFNPTIMGKAILPKVRWRTDSLNLLGFATRTEAAAPRISQYFDSDSAPAAINRILEYRGGALADGVNPRAVNASTKRLVRGQAFWFESNEASGYVGKLKVELGEGDGPHFGNTGTGQNLVLRNQGKEALTVTLSRRASETPPGGQASIQGEALLTFLSGTAGESEVPVGLNSPQNVTIPVGQSMTVRIGLDRSAMTGNPGDRFAALLKLETSDQEIDLGFSAGITSLAGLWIGEASINQVGSLLKRYQRNPDGTTIYEETTYDDPNGNSVTIKGKPLLVLNQDFTPAAADAIPRTDRPYPLRLLIHVDAAGNARLLSHIYQGLLIGAEPTIGLTTNEAALADSGLAKAIRLSVAHLPLDTKADLGSGFGISGELEADIITGHNDPDNPFIHAYHPDHDNLDARFDEAMPAGRESFNITRSMKFQFDAGAPDGVGSSWGTTLLTGFFSESINGTHKDLLRTRGPFALRKISAINQLTE